MTPTQHLESFDEKFGKYSEIVKFLTVKYGTHIHHEPCLNVIKQHLIQTVIAVLEDSVKSLNEQNNLIITCALSDGNEGIEWSVNKLNQTLSTWKELLEK